MRELSHHYRCMYSHVMSAKQNGKRVGRKRKGIFYVKASSFRNVSIKTTRKVSRETMRGNLYSALSSHLIEKYIRPAVE